MPDVLLCGMPTRESPFLRSLERFAWRFRTETRTYSEHSMQVYLRVAVQYADREMDGISMIPAEEDDLKNLPSVIMTSPLEWDPKVLDSEINLEQDDWYDSNDINTSRYFDYPFDETGLYRYCEI